MLLAIDTSTRHAGIALAQEGQVISCRNWYSQTNHSADLVPAISETLDQHGLSPKDLAYLSISIWPRCNISKQPLVHIIFFMLF